jgi:hypothetical protein
VILLLSALIGATLIVTRSTIFAPVRRLYPPLLSCSQCAGTWVGALAGGTGVVSVGRGPLIDAIVVGAATSFLALAADAAFVHVLGDPEDKP